MRLLEEVSYDLDFRKVRVICEGRLAIEGKVQKVEFL